MNRWRQLLVATLAGGLLVVAAPVAAHATEATESEQEGPAPEGEGGAEAEGPAAGTTEAECLEALLGGADLSDDACDPPNPILPEPSEILWAAIFFAIVAAFMMGFAVPKLRAAIGAREAKIRGDLEAAEQAKVAAEAAQVEYQRRLADARIEAGRIIDEARREADSRRQELVGAAEADAAAERARAAEELRAASARALVDLRSQVGVLSVDLAGRVVERPIDPASQQSLIDGFLGQVELGKN